VHEVAEVLAERHLWIIPPATRNTKNTKAPRRTFQEDEGGPVVEATLQGCLPIEPVRHLDDEAVPGGGGEDAVEVPPGGKGAEVVDPLLAALLPDEKERRP